MQTLPLCYAAKNHCFFFDRRHQYNFSLLLFRYLVYSRGQSEAIRLFPGFMSTLSKLREMAEILKNKTIKIWPTPTVEQYLDLFMENS